MILKIPDETFLRITQYVARQRIGVQGYSLAVLASLPNRTRFWFCRFCLVHVTMVWRQLFNVASCHSMLHHVMRKNGKQSMWRNWNTYTRTHATGNWREDKQAQGQKDRQGQKELRDMALIARLKGRDGLELQFTSRANPPLLIDKRNYRRRLTTHCTHCTHDSLEQNHAFQNTEYSRTPL